MGAHSSGQLDRRFVDRMREMLGVKAGIFFSTLDAGAPVSVLLNPVKQPGATLPVSGVVPWCPLGRYLHHRPDFTFDPQFHAGCYYVMEASSMFVCHALSSHIKATKPVRVLDLCAAPGGKSVALLTGLPPGSVLVANEVNASRFNTLQQNMDKWGAPNVVRTQLDPDQIPWTELFDVILVDAPCSGEGLFRKDKEARAEWSPAHVNLCSARQRRILAEAARLLAPGGILIYATCTFNDQENIEQVQWMAQQFSFNSVPVPVHDEWNITPQEVERNIGYRFFPHLLEGEGFFCAVMQKPVTEHDKTHSIKSRTARSEPVFQVSSLPKELTAWIDPVASAGIATIFTSADGRRYLHQSEFDTTWLRALRRMSPGTAIADQQSMIFTPAHALALSQCLHPDIPSLELDKDQAIVFLRKESVKANAADLGWYVARYDGHALGWLKQTHSGLKNYLPIKYRILKQ